MARPEIVDPRGGPKRSSHAAMRTNDPRGRETDDVVSFGSQEGTKGVPVRRAVA
jgi:hypothetical protein